MVAQLEEAQTLEEARAPLDRTADRLEVALQDYLALVAHLVARAPLDRTADQLEVALEDSPVTAAHPEARAPLDRTVDLLEVNHSTLNRPMVEVLLDQFHHQLVNSKLHTETLFHRSQFQDHLEEELLRTFKAHIQWQDHPPVLPAPMVDQVVDHP